MSLTINLTDKLYKRTAEIVAQQNVSIEEIVVLSLEEYLRAFERLKKHREQGSRDRFFGRLKRCLMLSHRTMTGCFSLAPQLHARLGGAH
jgi:hypothetical protein